MKRITLLLFALLGMTSFLSSCDEGDITDEVYVDDTDYYTVKFTGKVTGYDNWSNGYNVVLAAFDENADENSDNSVVQRQITPSEVSNDGTVTIVLPSVPTNATSIEFCVTNRLRHRIVTFESVAINPSEMSVDDTIYIKLSEPLNAGQFATIQSQVFDGAEYNCSMCHGAESPRANLCLQDGKSYSNLVNVASTRVDGGTRVIPGNSSESILHQVLSEGNPAGLRFDHSNILTDELKRMIDDWIDNGAKE